MQSFLSTPIIEIAKVRKAFPGVLALDDISLKIYPGRVHVLMGENGAGKSTLMKILSGIYTPTSGTITINNNEYSTIDRKIAYDNGIGIIFQELSIVNQLTVYENLFIGQIPTKNFLGIPGIKMVDHRIAIAAAKDIFAKLQVKINPLVLAGSLTISKKQIVEIAKVLLANPKILIMDEPTSSITSNEVKILFDIIRQLKDEGVAIVYISHKIDEILTIGDDISILRDGVVQATGQLRDFTKNEIVKKMVGRSMDNFYIKTKPVEPGATIKFEAKAITSRDKKTVRDVSFKVLTGEVLGFYGIVGSGRTELMQCLFGADQLAEGEIYINKRLIKIKSPLQAIKKGLSMITENRRETGFFANFNIEANIAVAKDIKQSSFSGMAGMLSKQSITAEAKRIIARLAIKSRSEKDEVVTLSGGNQQKVIIGKWLNTEPDVFIFDEPTRGVDVGAKLEIYQIIKELAESGKAIIVISSELPEIMSICHRVAVFNSGEIVDILEDKDISEEKIMANIV